MRLLQSTLSVGGGGGGGGLLLLLLAAAGSLPSSEGILYPRDSASRESKSLDGLWYFRTSPKRDPDQGFREKWYSAPLERSGATIEMPVPSSFNDITTDAALREYVGWAWYGRSFHVAPSWENQRVWLRFGSVHYTAAVYVNGEPAGNHSGGHIAFEMDITAMLSYSEENWITVAVNNTLTRYTVPQGQYTWRNESEGYPPDYSTLDITFDFFNYAGIHRPVVLYTTPRNIQIVDITTATTLAEDLSTAVLAVDVAFTVEAGEEAGVQCVLSLLDNLGAETVGEAFSCNSQIEVKQPQLWWPYLMSETPGYMHRLRVQVTSIKAGEDIYEIPIGLRQVTWGLSSFMINHRPFYFRGFGRHEDSDFRGKGLDLPLVARDYNLIKWVGANSYRTSHYPYADEIMDMADRQGIVIIDECPAVALDHFDDPLLENHLKAMEELVARDKNHPSVVMWSVGNEPRSTTEKSGIYFGRVAEHARGLDSTRPITLVANAQYDQDMASQHFDIIAINRYFSWYSDPGHLETVQVKLLTDLHNWRSTYGKPVMVTEYGADTLSGVHLVPSLQWSEEYQIELMAENFKVFDAARAEGWFIGEMIWNFADFMTKQENRRVAGNKKGIFTRDRQPKMAAHLMRSRYWQLAEEEGISISSGSSSSGLAGLMTKHFLPSGGGHQ